MGKVKCRRCEGQGQYVDYEETCFAAYFKRCERCGGTGYVEEGGETISYSSGKAPEPDTSKLVRELRGSIEIRNTVGKPIYKNLSEPLLVKKISALCDALEEREREAQAYKDAIARTRSSYPEDVFRPGPPYRTIDAQSADWARRVCDTIEGTAQEILAAREREGGDD